MSRRREELNFISAPETRNRRQWPGENVWTNQNRISYEFLSAKPCTVCTCFSVSDCCVRISMVRTILSEIDFRSNLYPEHFCRHNKIVLTDFHRWPREKRVVNSHKTKCTTVRKGLRLSIRWRFRISAVILNWDYSWKITETVNSVNVPGLRQLLRKIEKNHSRYTY